MDRLRLTGLAVLLLASACERGGYGISPPSLVEAAQACAGVDCSGRGQCLIEPSTGAAHCACDRGFANATSTTCEAAVIGSCLTAAECNDANPDIPTAAFACDQTGHGHRCNGATLESLTCPLGCNAINQVCNVASNIPGAAFEAGLGDLDLTSATGQVTIDTDSGAIFDGAGAIRPAGVGRDPATQTTLSIANQPGERALVVLAVNDLVVPAGRTVSVVGSHPFAVAATGHITISGTVDGGANGALGGPGGYGGSGGLGIASTDGGITANDPTGLCGNAQLVPITGGSGGGGVGRIRVNGTTVNLEGTLSPALPSAATSTGPLLTQ